MKNPLPRLGLAILAVLPLCLGGCATQVVARPKDATLSVSPSPQPAETARVSQDYRDNPSMADASYQGKRLIFNEVRIESVVRTVSNYYFTAGNIRFRPTCMGDLDYLAEGTVVSVVGECQGLLWGYVYFNDCWIGILSGGLAAPRSGY